MNSSSGCPISIAPGLRLQWEETQQCHVLLYPEGMVKLNPSAAEILKHCDGSLTADGILAALQDKFPDAELAADVANFLRIAHEKGWIRGE
jgi:pyrroloquinoline quinone biosynthesis protein D